MTFVIKALLRHTAAPQCSGLVNIHALLQNDKFVRFCTDLAEGTPMLKVIPRRSSAPRRQCTQG